MDFCCMFLHSDSQNKSHYIVWIVLFCVFLCVRFVFKLCMVYGIQCAIFPSFIDFRTFFRSVYRYLQRIIVSNVLKSAASRLKFPEWAHWLHYPLHREYYACHASIECNVNISDNKGRQSARINIIVAVVCVVKL